VNDKVQELIKASDEVCSATIDFYARRWSDLNDNDLVVEVVSMAKDCVETEKLAMEKIDSLGDEATEEDHLTLGLAVMAKLGSAMVASGVLAKRFGGAS
jgi:hypothetical protein